MRVTLSSTDRPRDGRAAPAVFTPGANFLRVPGYPDELRDVVPRADGQPGPRDERFYGPAWIRAERVRAIKIQTDLLYQFAGLVAGITGHSLDTYWRGGAGHSAITDMLIANVVVDFSQLSSGGSLDEATAAAHRAELERVFSKVDDYDTRQRVKGFITTPGGNEDRSAAAQTPEERAAMERIIRRYEETEFSRGKAASSSSAAPASSPLSSRPVSATGPVLSNAAPPPAPSTTLHERAGPTNPTAHRRVIVTPAREEGQREEAAAAPPADRLLSANDPKSGAPVYGVNNENVMLLRILLRGATTADLEAWRMLYGKPEKGKDTQDARARMLKDVASMQTLLRRGEGGLDWVRAPQHTGYIFFSESFGAGVEAAATDVHLLCGKSWAAEIDLMTHERVRRTFARLVANHIVASRARNAPRWGGSTAMIREHRDEHDKLVRAFRRLTQDGDGYLGLEGQIATDGERARRATNADRDAYTARTGQYFSDVRQ